MQEVSRERWHAPNTSDPRSLNFLPRVELLLQACHPQTCCFLFTEYNQPEEPAGMSARLVRGKKKVSLLFLFLSLLFSTWHHLYIIYLAETCNITAFFLAPYLLRNPRAALMSCIYSAKTLLRNSHCVLTTLTRGCYNSLNTRDPTWALVTELMGSKDLWEPEGDVALTGSHWSCVWQGNGGNQHLYL